MPNVATSAGPDRLYPGQWIASIGRAIDEAVMSCFPRSWSEDLITETVLRALIKNFPSVELNDWRHEMFQRNQQAEPGVLIRWDAFKLRGGVEKDRGDVAILVIANYHDASPLEGVAYLEAKRIYPKSASFDGIRHWEQLERMERLTPHHHVILYDNEPYDLEKDFPGRLPWFWTHNGGNKRMSSRAVVVQTNYLTATRRKDRSVYRQAVPLADQLLGDSYQATISNMIQWPLWQRKASWSLLAGLVTY